MTENKIFGYVRVSSKEQNEARQVEDMLKLGIKSENIFVDKASGKDFNRPQYQELKKYLRKGDTLIIKSLDRLGRDFDLMSKEWQELTEEKEVYIRIIDFPQLNTDRQLAEDDLMNKVISKIIFTLLNYVAQQEREFIKDRRTQGIAIAKAKGKYKKNRIEMPENFIELFNKAVNGGKEYTHTQAMKELGLNKTTYYRIAKEHGLKTNKNTIVRNKRRINK